MTTDSQAPPESVVLPLDDPPAYITLPEGVSPDQGWFWERVDFNGPVPPHCPTLGPCWLWADGRSKDGRPTCVFHGRAVRVYRVSAALTIGDPAGRVVMHRCDNPRCVRPSHLALGSQSENMRDCIRKGRRASTAGEQNPRAKIKAAQVVEIRAARDRGVGLDELAARFNLAVGTVAAIVYRQRWKNV